MPLINAFKCQGLKGLLQHWEMAKCMMMPACSFIKYKDRGASWIYRYTLHECRRKIGLGALRDVSLKQACEYMQFNVILFCVRDVPR